MCVLNCSTKIVLDVRTNYWLLLICGREHKVFFKCLLTELKVPAVFKVVLCTLKSLKEDLLS